jgi:hypothetical protein
MVTHVLCLQKRLFLSLSRPFALNFAATGYAARRIGFHSTAITKRPRSPTSTDSMAANLDPASQSQATMKLENVCIHLLV